MIGAFLLCMGAGIHIKAAPKALLIGGSITLTKFIVAVALGFGVERLFGAEGLWGLSSVAIIAAMSNTNGDYTPPWPVSLAAKRKWGRRR